MYARQTVNYLKETIVLLLVINLLFIVRCERNKSLSHVNSLSKVALSKQKKDVIYGIKSLRDILSVADTIQLETTKESLIGNIFKVCKHPKGYVVMDSQISKKVYLFGKDGSFISVLGGNGKGPSEYIYPTDIAVTSTGDCYVLDSTQRKIIIYDINCKYQRIVNFNNLNIFPSGFSIIDKGLLSIDAIIFYNLHPDLGRRVDNHKIIIVDVSGKRCNVVKHFGEQEPLLKKLFYDMGCYHITKNGIVWIADVFDLDINIFNVDGNLLKKAQRHLQLIPEPHMNPERMEKFKRASESIDTYYNLTGLRNMVFLDSLIIAYYGNTNRHKFYCMIFDYTGEPLLPKVITTKKMVPGPIVGFWNNELFCSIEPKVSEKTLENIPNPNLIVYNLKLELNTK